MKKFVCIHSECESMVREGSIIKGKCVKGRIVVGEKFCNSDAKNRVLFAKGESLPMNGGVWKWMEVAAKAQKPTYHMAPAIWVKNYLYVKVAGIWLLHMHEQGKHNTKKPSELLSLRNYRPNDRQFATDSGMSMRQLKTQQFMYKWVA